MPKKERQEEANEKRGRNITLLAKVEKQENDQSPEFKLVAGENEGIRTVAQVREWMQEKNFIGTVYPVRLQKPITRAEQTVVKFS